MPFMRIGSISDCWIDWIDTLQGDWLASGVSIRGLNELSEFQGSEQTHLRLRQDICRLWGESYLDDKTGMQLEAGKRALGELESQLRAIRG